MGDDAEYGNLETYSIFPGVILSYIDLNIDNMDEVFFEEKIDNRLLEINHCAEGRYSYAVGDDKIVYFGKGDLCVSIYDLTKTLSDFPLGYYKGLEIFIDVDVANDYIKEYIPDFDVIEFYEDLEKSKGYVLIRSNEKIDHVIGVPLGIAVLQYLFGTMGDSFYLPVHLSLKTLVVTFLITYVVSVLVNLMFSGKLKKLDMVESLKDNE